MVILIETLRRRDVRTELGSTMDAMAWAALEAVHQQKERGSDGPASKQSGSRICKHTALEKIFSCRRPNTTSRSQQPQECKLKWGFEIGGGRASRSTESLFLSVGCNAFWSHRPTATVVRRARQFGCAACRPRSQSTQLASPSHTQLAAQPKCLCSGPCESPSPSSFFSCPFFSFFSCPARNGGSRAWGAAREERARERGTQVASVQSSLAPAPAPCLSTTIPLPSLPPSRLHPSVKMVSNPPDPTVIVSLGITAARCHLSGQCHRLCPSTKIPLCLDLCCEGVVN